jgi:hypothetical protein
LSFAQSNSVVDAYDFVEVKVAVSRPHAANPFIDAELNGWFELAGDNRKRWSVLGFCDSDDGSTFRIRFMPPQVGPYHYFVEYRQGASTRTFSGTFTAIDGKHTGPIRVDVEHPWHFVWEGTGQHYFFNGTTAYWLVGWSDEKTIENSLERLHRYKVNRVRVTLAGRTNNFFGEPVMVDRNWTVFLTPWPSKLPQDVYHPGFDFGRFDVGYWQKFDRMLRMARERDMIVSVILDMKDSQTHPVAASEDERRFIRYAVARFAAFSNITWDLGDDLDLYRDWRWTNETGTLIQSLDPYHHLATSHPVNNKNQDRASEWFGFTSFQEWSRKQHEFMLLQRQLQKATGRIIPQTNEEYGYEDHSPLWSESAESESGNALRRTAWAIAMAGGYQTTGESARRGTNIWPDKGGGWMNGRGDDTMTMLQGYENMVNFFTSFEWWTAEPHDELVDNGNYCLAKEGQIYAVYLPHGGNVNIKLQEGTYEVKLFNPAIGSWTSLGSTYGGFWSFSGSRAEADWALLLQKKF